MDTKSTKCYLIGYEGHKKYRLWDPKKKDVIVSAHVLFDEKATDVGEKYTQKEYEQIDDSHPTGSVSGDQIIDAFENQALTSPKKHFLKQNESASISYSGNLSESDSGDKSEDLDHSEDSDHESSTHDTDAGDTDTDAPSRPQTPPPRRSQRSQPPRDYLSLHDPHKRNNFRAPPEEDKGKTATTKVRMGFAVRAVKADLPVIPEVPQNVYEALNGPDKDKWMGAFQEELNSHETQETWHLVPLPHGKKALPGRWVLAIKFANRILLKFKARWVVKGYRQIEGIDFDETFSCVLKSNNWRILMSLGAKEDMEIDHVDIITAFLESPLYEEVYVEQPHGFEEGNDLVCRLRKALYGLKQAHREWYSTLREFFKELGFVRVQKDHSVFIRGRGCSHEVPGTFQA